MQKQEQNFLPKTLKEARESGGNKYFTGKPCVHGHISYRYVSDRLCSVCAKQKSTKYKDPDASAKHWASLTQEQKNKINEKRRIYWQKTKEQRNEQKKSRHKKAMQDHSYAERIRVYVKEYRSRHEVSLKRKAEIATRRASKAKRTPKWADMSKIVEFYKGCPDGYHVDHVIPLRGNIVSGLHVIDNLQYLPARENISKSNRYEIV